MSQNIYDDANFFAGYATLDRSVKGLDGAPEWPAIQQILPTMRDLRAVDWAAVTAGFAAGRATRAPRR